MSAFIGHPSNRYLNHSLLEGVNVFEANFIDQVKFAVSNQTVSLLKIEELLRSPQIALQVKTYAVSLAILANHASLLDSIYSYGGITSLPSQPAILEAKESGCSSSLGYLYKKGLVSYNDYLEAKQIEKDQEGARVFRYESPRGISATGSTDLGD